MSPEENFQFINEYLKFISPAISQHHGFIDKFIGDAIMALFPGNPEDAIKASLSMCNYLSDFNIFRQQKGLQPINIGIGIHHGGLMLGTVGVENRMDGTVISDTVNLASRLESLTKKYGARIILTESIIQKIMKKSDNYSFRYLGKVTVKGKSKPATIYELLDGRLAAEKESILLYKHEFENAIHLYEVGQHAESLKVLDGLKQYQTDKAITYIQYLIEKSKS
jgi:class 3 adenylate cyclase